MIAVVQSQFVEMGKKKAALKGEKKCTFDEERKRYSGDKRFSQDFPIDVKKRRVHALLPVPIGIFLLIIQTVNSEHNRKQDCQFRPTLACDQVEDQNWFVIMPSYWARERVSTLSYSFGIVEIERLMRAPVQDRR